MAARTVSNGGSTYKRIARRSINSVSWAVAIGMLGLFLWASVKLMSGPDFNDETEKLIASQLMLGGQRLYKDIFVQHGPFVYMLSHLFDMVTGNRELYWPRLIPIVMSLLAIASIAASPALTGMRTRLWATTFAAAAFGLLLALYSLVMTMYQVYSGYLFTIALALAFVPAALGIKLRRWHLICSGAALAAMGLNAISFGIAIALGCAALAVAYLPNWREVGRVVGWTMVGALALVAVVFTWVALFADFIGFFVDHVYINLTAYRHYLAGQSLSSSLRLILPWQPWVVTVPPGHSILELIDYSLLFFAVAGLLAVSLLVSKRRWWHTALILGLLYVGLAYTNPRFALGFGASTYMIILSAFVVLVGLVCLRSRMLRWPALALVGILLGAGVFAQLSVPTALYGLPVATYYRTDGPLYQRDDAEFALVRDIVEEDEGILQVPFDLYRYVWAGRNPATGVFFWMPWMHDYGQHPILGYDLDVCADVDRTQPKVIYFNDFAVWKNPTDKWMSCLKDIVDSRYVRVGALGERAMVRADVLAARPDLWPTALVTDALDLSNLTADRASALRGLALRFGELQRDEICLAETGTPGGDGQISAQPCLADPAIRIAARGEQAETIVDLKNGLCLEQGDRIGFTACDDTSKAQAFRVIATPDAANEIRSVTDQAMCIDTPTGGFALVACSENSLWRKPDRQEFAIRRIDDQRSEIVSRSTGWCMEVTGASSIIGGGIRVWPCTGSEAQAFRVTTGADGKMELRNVFSDLCVTIKDETVSQQICDSTTRLSLVTAD